MKLFSKFLALGVLTLGLFSCSTDEPGASGGDIKPSEDGIYSSVKFTFPKTRSTASEGEEVGQDYENNIGSILVVLAQKGTSDNDYQFLSFALNDAPLTNSTNNTYTVTFQDKETLFAHPNTTVYVFAYCNPSQELRDKIAGQLGADGIYTGGLNPGDSFTDEIYAADPYNTWKKNGFLMTSVEIVSKELPSAEELKTYNSPSNAFDLGTIPVMRTMSRFDFRDASKEGDLTYSVKDPNDESKEQGKVKFTRVALFNLADQFYYLPRIGESANSFTLCPGFNAMEVEGDNFVISAPSRGYLENMPTADLDPLARPANPVDPTKEIAADAKGSLQWYSLSSILGYDEDNDSGWGANVDPATDKLGYHIWRYGTENTFFAGENTVNNTTGYVFEAEILPAADFGNKAADGSLGVMYLYKDVLYPNATEIYKAVQLTPVSTLATAFENAFNVEKNAAGEVTSITPVSDEKVKAMGFTAYKPNSEGKYYCYYFAFNTHNANNNPTEVGNMEFASVRNNVYKLAINTVKKFGTFTPPTEVEEWDTYFTLDVQVKPWVVRINNLDF